MAKRVGNIYLLNCNYTCLYNAYRKAAKGKRYRGDVLQFTDNLEGNLLALLDDLKNHTYTVGAYREFYVYEPKKRLIMALPFRDRVAQWWVYSLLYPIFDKTFIEDSYACRRGKGQKAAADRLQDMIKQTEVLGGKWYYLKLDIAKYFYRIYHDKLMEILERKIKDPDMLELLNVIVKGDGTPFRDELKTDLSRRSLMITEEMVLLLIFWRLIQNTEKKKAAERGVEYNPDNLVFCTRKGTYIYPRNFTKMWSENLRSMGIDHKRFHDLRHTVATVMLEDGEAMNTVQEQLGHYDAGFTASRYGHVTAKMRNSAAVKLGERLEKVRNPEAEDAEDANSVKNEDTVIPFQEGHKLKSAACKIK